MRIWLVLSILFLLLATISSDHARPPDQREQSCRNFVQDFYDWYAPKAADDALKSGPLNLAMRVKRHAFTSELARQLKELLEFQERDREVWLDFDPLLNSQDPAERYVAGKVVRAGSNYLVEVHEIRSGKESEKPVVLPELMIKDGQWSFVNFHYPNFTPPSPNENLLDILKSIRQSRQKQPKSDG
jgi:hypothetical protein